MTIASGSDPQGSAGLCSAAFCAQRVLATLAWLLLTEGQRAASRRKEKPPAAWERPRALHAAMAICPDRCLDPAPQAPTCRGWSLGLRFPKGFRQASSGSAVGRPAKPAGAAAETEEEARGRACFPSYSWGSF